MNKRLVISIVLILVGVISLILFFNNRKVDNNIDKVNINNYDGYMVDESIVLSKIDGVYYDDFLKVFSYDLDGDSNIYDNDPLKHSLDLNPKYKYLNSYKMNFNYDDKTYHVLVPFFKYNIGNIYNNNFITKSVYMEDSNRKLNLYIYSSKDTLVSLDYVNEGYNNLKNYYKERNGKEDYELISISNIISNYNIYAYSYKIEKDNKKYLKIRYYKTVLDNSVDDNVFSLYFEYSVSLDYLESNLNMLDELSYAYKIDFDSLLL